MKKEDVGILFLFLPPLPLFRGYYGGLFFSQIKKAVVLSSRKQANSNEIIYFFTLFLKKYRYNRCFYILNNIIIEFLLNPYAHMHARTLDKYIFIL